MKKLIIAACVAAGLAGVALMPARWVVPEIRKFEPDGCYMRDPVPFKQLGSSK